MGRGAKGSKERWMGTKGKELPAEPTKDNSRSLEKLGSADLTTPARKPQQAEARLCLSKCVPFKAPSIGQEVESAPKTSRLSFAFPCEYSQSNLLLISWRRPDPPARTVSGHVVGRYGPGSDGAVGRDQCAGESHQGPCLIDTLCQNMFNLCLQKCVRSQVKVLSPELKSQIEVGSSQPLTSSSRVPI